MTDESDYFMREPNDSPLHKFVSKHGTTMEMLRGYKPKRTEELAEWLMIASRNVVDAEGLLVFVPLKPFAAYQIARMMQIAKLKVPHDKP
jgi:hypothetical protein